jgi:hypothetical protein
VFASRQRPAEVGRAALMALRIVTPAASLIPFGIKTS